MKPIDIVIICIVAAAFIGAIAYLIWKKKKGISGCGCGCSSCPHAGACHSQSTKPKVPQEEEKIENEGTHV